MTSAPAASSSASGESACTLTAADIAAIVGGELYGIQRQRWTGRPLARAQKTSLFLAYGRPPVSRELTRSSRTELSIGAASRARIVVESRRQHATLLPFYLERRAPSIHSTASIGRGATIGEGVTLEEYAVIGEGASVGDGAVIGAHSVVGRGASIGKSSRLFPHATVYAGAEIGERVILHSGVRIGSDGFGYVFPDEH